MNECPNCGHRGVIWDSDFTFEDLGYDGEGVVYSMINRYRCMTFDGGK